MVFLTNLLNYKRHITESDNGYVPYCFFCNAVFSQSTSKICTLIRFTLFSNESDIVKTLSVVLLPYRFTLFSNVCHKRNSHERVLLPYRFTLFSNRRLPFHQVSCVLLPYRFTLFSNTRLLFRCLKLFYYLIDLHYSQTYSFAHFSEQGFTTL